MSMAVQVLALWLLLSSLVASAVCLVLRGGRLAEDQRLAARGRDPLLAVPAGWSSPGEGRGAAGGPGATGPGATGAGSTGTGTRDLG